MHPSGLHRTVALTLALLLIATPGEAYRLMELDGIELHGTARILTYGATTCHVLEEKYFAEDYERLKGNEGRPLDLWQLDFSVYNGSGKALDYLIARYGIESPWPPCTNWSYKPGIDASEASWSSEGGHIQRAGEPYSVAPGETVTEALFFIVFHEDEPSFTRWSVDYNFAEGVQAAQTQTAPAAPATPAPGSSFHDWLSSGDEGPEMVVIPAGRFRMGDLSGAGYDDEKPVHEVVFARPFAISKYEVTFEDYDKFTYPNKVDDAGLGRGRRPVFNVSWDEANVYAAWLSAETGKRYRLPTEAEWEYAARAGSTTKYHFGNDKSQLCQYANHGDATFDSALQLEAEGCADGDLFPAVVGRYRPNAFGLYDMYGNLWEWVQDCWKDSYAGAPTDGSAWTSGDCGQRVVRGGSWFYNPRNLRSAYRHWITRSASGDSQGFRLVQDL